jgi:Domain of unknown function (DUF1707)
MEAPVMPEPGAQMAAAAGGRGRLRASHADRERAIDVLKAAFVQGRLAKDEFEARVTRAFVSRTYAELAAVTADIPPPPPAPPAVPSPPQPARPRARPSMNQAVTGGACVVIAAHIGMLAALLTGSGAVVILVAVLIVVGAAVAVAAMIVAS